MKASAASAAATPRIDGAPAALAALAAERLRLYRAGKWSAIAGQVIIGALMLWVVYGHVPPRAQGLAIAVVLVALVTRAVSDAPWRARGGHPTPAAAELSRTRAAVLGTAAAMGFAALWLFPARPFEAQVFVTFMMAALAAGALTLTSFDLGVALAYALLVLVPVVARLLLVGTPPAVATGAAALLFVAFLAINGRRAQRNMRLTMAVREADQQRTASLLESQRRLEDATVELRRAAEDLRLTFEHMEQGIWCLGADGRTSFFNRRMCELTGLPEAFMATRPSGPEIARYQEEHGHFDGGQPQLEAPVREGIRRWSQGVPAPFPPQYFRRTHQGKVLDVKSTALPGGGFVRTYADVTALVEANERVADSEAQQRKLALVAAHTDDAVVITDPERRIEWVNAAFTRLSGYPLAEVLGRRTGEFLRGPLTDAATAARIDEALRHAQKAHGEILHYRKDGSSYWFALETHAVRADDGRVLQFIGVGRDVTARREADAALRAARDEAERASRAKSDFLSAMSHELRTPLNAILGFAQLLQANTREPLPARQREYVRRIGEAGSHLLDLINDVLDLARVEAGREVITFEAVALPPLVAECLRLTRPLAAERGIEVAAALPAGLPRVRADPLRLKQVLLNLLANAIKYNHPAGRVRLTGSVTGGHVDVVVSDSGPGLDLQAQARLFTAFERLGAEHGPVEGAGVGLVLSRRLLALMHGTIEAASEPGQGSCFTVTLPAATADEKEAAAAPAGAPSAASAAAAATASTPAEATPDTTAAAPGGTVLYIEDNPVNLVLMQSMLDALPGVRLLLAERALPGLALAQAERPDLILLDIQLPEVDGYEALRRLRADARTAAIPVVAISANAMRGDIERGLAAGFDDYMTKPLDVAALRAMVQQRLSAAARRPQRP
ncbi:MAG: PAS-domain containing protein [Betaproteobacteria bacterium]|nr:PAS-domain containing protein [Betaproteobacteria bacterium]MCC6248723.1 PAS-domain containing protein [Rubrivivax sp.]